MTDFNQNIDQAKDLLNLEDKDMQKLPQMLNILTILTYIGCGLGLIGAVYNYFTIGVASKLYNAGAGTTSTGDKTIDSMLSGVSEMVKKQYDNRLMILVFALIGVALCFYGAMQMRNLKKQGFLFYLVGEILPIISFALFVGFGNIFGAAGMIFSVLFAALFIILYATQRKYLVN
jgi:hypothetical protein